MEYESPEMGFASTRPRLRELKKRLTSVWIQRPNRLRVWLILGAIVCTVWFVLSLRGYWAAAENLNVLASKKLIANADKLEPAPTLSNQSNPRTSAELLAAQSALSLDWNSVLAPLDQIKRPWVLVSVSHQNDSKLVSVVLERSIPTASEGAKKGLTGLPLTWRMSSSSTVNGPNGLMERVALTFERQ